MAATLTAHLKLDRSGFAAGLKSARKNLADFSAGARSLAGSAVRGGLLAIGAGGAVAAVGLAAGVKSAYDLGGSLRDLSDRTGISAGKLLILQQAFKDNGLAADDVGASVNKMQKFLDSAKDSASPAAAVLNGLGLELSTISGMTPDKQFEAIGKAIDAIEDPSTRATASMALFGKTGGKFLALFAAKGAISVAAAALGKQADILDKSAGTFDDISGQLGRSGTKLQGFFVGVAATLAATVGPLLDRFDKTDFSGIGLKFGASLIAGADMLLGAFKDPQKALGAFGSYMEGVMAQAGNILAAGLQTVTNVFAAGFSDTIQGIGRLLLGTLLESFSQPLAWFQASLQASLSLMDPKNLKDALSLKGTNNALAFQRNRMQEASASGDNAGMQDAMNQIGLLTTQANEISNRMAGGSVEERMAAILATGGPSLNMGAAGQLNAAGLKASGSALLASGASAGAAASGFHVNDLFGAQAKFAAAAPLVAGLQSSGSKIRTAATTTKSNRPQNAYEAQLYEMYGPAQFLNKRAEAEQFKKDQKAQASGAIKNPVSEKSATLQEQMAKALTDLVNINKEAWAN